LVEALLSNRVFLQYPFLLRLPGLATFLEPDDSGEPCKFLRPGEEPPRFAGDAT